MRKLLFVVCVLFSAGTLAETVTLSWDSDLVISPNEFSNVTLDVDLEGEIPSVHGRFAVPNGDFILVHGVGALGRGSASGVAFIDVEFILTDPLGCGITLNLETLNGIISCTAGSSEVVGTGNLTLTEIR